MIAPNAKLSVSRQCTLLGIARSSFYYQPRPTSAAELDLLLAQPGGDRIDTVVLACTHFPLLADELAAAAPRPLTLIDSGDGIARRIAFLTTGQAWPADPGDDIAVFTSDLDIDALAPELTRRGLSQIERL